MAVNDLSEKEQLDELKAWWAENRAWVLGGIAIGLAIIIGFRSYTSAQIGASTEASTHYEQLAEEVSADRLEPAEDIAATLFADYSGTVYADQARLAMARLYMDRGRDGDAAEVLRPLAARGDEPIELVGRLRLAQILLYQDKPQEALELLDVPEDSAFAARYNDVIGDAHYALGQLDEAAAAWNAVLADTEGQQTVDAAFVRMKLADLPEADDGAVDDDADAGGEQG